MAPITNEKSTIVVSLNFLNLYKPKNQEKAKNTMKVKQPTKANTVKAKL